MSDVFGFNARDARDLIADIGRGDKVQRLNLSGVRFIRFQLTANLTTTSTTANIFDAAGTTIASGATIEDPETIFTGLTNATRGIGIQQGARYFIVNANCPAEP
jgi:hypothetical protein